MHHSELKRIRTTLEHTQASLAAELDVDANTVARWERGEVKVPLVVAKLLKLMAKTASPSSVNASTGLARDPHHEKILKALSTPLDPEVFEACAADLLHSVYPSLAPMAGGSDGGFDGAVVEPGKPPIPLITTIGADAKGNLTRNLKKVIEKSARPETAIFATPRRLTPATIGKLRNCASTLGVNTLQVFEQRWFANALYRDSAWTKKLLSLSGRPSALSVVPLVGRPPIGSKVFGRERELQRLREAKSDALLVGGPGSGKTFLLRALANEGAALFLTDNDKSAVADAVRAQEPKAIIIDDAHHETERIESLAQLRQEIRADYRIIAVTWPAEAQNILNRFDVSPENVVELELLNKSTMVEVIKSIGIFGPSFLLHSIVQQAGGRPGLAVTLASLAKQGGIEGVWHGQPLADALRVPLRELCNEDPSLLLACFALGGDSGFQPETVSKFLARPVDEVSRMLTRLGTTGVIRSNGRDNAVSVWPEEYRWVLLRNCFFGGAGSIDYRPLLSKARSSEEAVLALIGAQSRGANVDNLYALVEERGTQDVLHRYASLGAREAQLVVHRHPEMVTRIASAALANAPEEALPVLLGSAIDDSRELHAHPDHPLRQIQEWLARKYDQHSRTHRSQLLVTSVVKWWRQRGIRSEEIGNVAIRAFALAFDLNWTRTESDPGDHHALIIENGVANEEDSKELMALWSKHKSTLELGKHSGWKDLILIIHNISHSPYQVTVPDSLYKVRRDFAERILTDVASYARGNSAVQRQIREIAERMNYCVRIEQSTEFDILFPTEKRSDDWEAQAREWHRAARDLSKSWSTMNPVEGAKKIVEIETAAKSVGVSWPRCSPVLFDEISKTTSEPNVWIDALIAAAAPSDLVRPFVNAVANKGPHELSRVARQCFEHENYRCLGVEAALAATSAPPSLLKEVAASADTDLKIIKGCCMFSGVSPGGFEMLLDFGSPAVALASAVGEWLAARRTSRNVRLSQKWQQAILGSAHVAEFSDDCLHWLVEILKGQSQLAFRWFLELSSRNAADLSYRQREIGKRVAAVLDKEQRTKIVAAIKPRSALTSLVRAIVGNDLDVYRELLGRADLLEIHLDPIGDSPSADWRERALLALDHGATVTEIYDATRPRMRSWSGPESAMLSERKRVFEAYLIDPDRRIESIARKACDELEKSIKNCLMKEKLEAVYGS